jgi:hypothetical protein
MGESVSNFRLRLLAAGTYCGFRNEKKLQISDCKLTKEDHKSYFGIEEFLRNDSDGVGLGGGQSFSEQIRRVQRRNPMFTGR